MTNPVPAFDKYTKTLRELRKIGDSIKRVFDKENPLMVDIERTIEGGYGIIIDLVPLIHEGDRSRCHAEHDLCGYWTG